MEYKELKQLIERNRSYRRFKESERISGSDLENLVDLARYCASGRNLQPMKYRIVSSESECAEVFPLLAWAGYLSDWDGPAEGERPAAYLIQCLDLGLTQNPMCDDGLQLEAILLGAVAMGYGGCIIKSFNKEKLAEVLGLPEHLEPRYVLALGVPVEKVEIKPMKAGDIKYWRDTEGVHYVPKRSLKEILVK